MCSSVVLNRLCKKLRFYLYHVLKYKYYQNNGNDEKEPLLRLEAGVTVHRLTASIQAL